MSHTLARAFARPWATRSWCAPAANSSRHRAPWNCASRCAGSSTESARLMQPGTEARAALACAARVRRARATGVRHRATARCCWRRCRQTHSAGHAALHSGKRERRHGAARRPDRSRHRHRSTTGVPKSTPRSLYEQSAWWVPCRAGHALAAGARDPEALRRRTARGHCAQREAKPANPSIHVLAEAEAGAARRIVLTVPGVLRRLDGGCSLDVGSLRAGTAGTWR